MRVENYFQPPIPTRREVSSAYKTFLEDFGRWLATKGEMRPFEDSPPYYVQLGYEKLCTTGGYVCLLPDEFGREFDRLRAATCAAAMIDQDMYQLFRGNDLYRRFRTRFAFPKLEHHMPPINFVNENILKDKDLVRLMKSLYFLVFRWLSDQPEDGNTMCLRCYKQLRADNKEHAGLRGVLWRCIFTEVTQESS